MTRQIALTQALVLALTAPDGREADGDSGAFGHMTYKGV